MGIIIRQSIKASIVSYIGIALGAINILYFFPLFLTPTYIGLIETIRGIAMIILPFAHFGMPAIINKFLPYFQDRDLKHHGFLLFAIVSFLIGFVFISILIYTFREIILDQFKSDSPLLSSYYLYIIPLVFYTALFAILSAYSASFLRITVPNILHNIVLRLLVLVDILLYASGIIEFRQFFFIFINIYAVPLLLIFIYLNLEKQLHFSSFKRILKEKFKSIFSFGIYTVFFNASEIFINKIDIVMLSMLLSLENTGIYAIAFFMGSVIEVPKRMISSLALPVLASSFKEENYTSIKELYQKTSINQLFIGSLIFLLIWANINSIFQFIPNGEIYITGKYVVLFIGIAKIIDMLMGCNLEIMVISKYYRFNLITTTFLVIALIVTNLIFIPRFGITGAAFASALAILLFNTINYLFIYMKLDMQPFTIQTFKGIMIFAIVLIATYVLPDLENKYLNIVFNSSIIVMIFIPAYFFLNLSPDINKLINKVINNQN